MNLTEADFRAWLEAQDGDTVVGLCRSSFICPIAKWLVSQYGVRSLGDIDVDEGEIRITGERSLTPPWASHFILTIDAIPQPRMTARQALAILDRISMREPAT